MVKNLDDKVDEWWSAAGYAAAGAAGGMAADFVRISDNLVARLGERFQPIVSQYDILAPSFYTPVNYPLFDIAAFGGFVSGVAGKPKGALISWAAATGYGLLNAAWDYGAGNYVGGFISVVSGVALPAAAFVGLGMAAGYVVRAIYKGLKRLFVGKE